LSLRRSSSVNMSSSSKASRMMRSRSDRRSTGQTA
jgi:hypothetical protein